MIEFRYNNLFKLFLRHIYINLKILNHSIKRSILNKINYFDYKISIFMNQPYFGKYMTAGQAWPPRRKIMFETLKREREQNKKIKDYKILEVGSWGGQSTCLWGKICKKFGGCVYCIDTWRAAPNAPEIMKNAVKKDQIFKLFLHNVKFRGLNDYIIPIRGTSDDVANILKEEWFDFVYIDGDHGYSQFKKDLINYSKFCKVGGIVCGDDLEVIPSELDLNNARKNSEVDLIEDPKTNKYFHPGIALAIYEFFGDVSMYNGFWAMRKTKTGWRKINLN